MQKNILLLQIRNSHEIADHEHNCFSNALRELGDVNLRQFNVYTEEFDSEGVVENFDGIIVGGSYNAPYDPFPNREEVEFLLEEVLDRRVPYLGVCYGFELLIHFLGGEMIRDRSRACFGTEEIYLTEEGQDNLLLSDVPDQFLVQEAHDWIVEELPDSLEKLAYSEHVPYQAVRVTNMPVYGVQFHPELNEKEILRRMKFNQLRDEVSFDNLEGLIEEVKPSPHALKVVLNFVEKVIPEKS